MLIIAFFFIYSQAIHATSLKQKFIVSQSMHYKDPIDLSFYGILRNPIIYESSLLPSRSSDVLIQGETLKALASKIKNGPLPTVIDIERWTIYTLDKVVRDQNRTKLLNVLSILREARPDMKFGYYGVVPSRIYWPHVDKELAIEKREWDLLNAAAFSDFVPYLDAIFPSLYTFYEDQSGWENYAKQTLMAVKKFGKPVYCYLWPQYHDSNIKLKGQYLDKKYWRLELETCRKYSDGIVIWNVERNKVWDEDAPWWNETKDFLKTFENN